MVYQRDEYSCQYCGIHCYESYVNNPKSVTIDHATPFSHGGSNSPENLITCCRECNGLKWNMIFKTFEEAREYVLSKKG